MSARARAVDARGPATVTLSQVTAPAVLRLAPSPAAEPRADGRDWAEAEPPARGQVLLGTGGLDEHGTYVQGALAVDLREDAYDSFFGPQATGTADLPDVGPWARRIIQAVLEVCEGTRSTDQLSRWLTPEIRERVGRRGQLARRRARRSARPPVVRTLRTCHPADGVCEVAAVVWTGGRTRALAVRLSGVDGRWLVTALELG